MQTALPPLREAGAQLAVLDLAIDEFFEEGYAYQVNRHEIESTSPDLRSEALRQMLPQRSQAEGYFTWLRYLIWLDGIREIVPDLALSRTEAEGLALYRRCRNKFQREHPPCIHCGMPNAQEEYCCHSCLKEIKR